MSYPRGSGPFTLGPWPKGINNVKDEASLDRDELRDAKNVVLNAEGEAETRPGIIKIVSATQAMSMFKVDEQYAVYFDAGDLLLLNVPARTTTPLGSGFARGVRASWVRIGSRIFFTNGRQHGRIHVPTWEVLEGFGPPNPGLTVSLTTLGYGSLAAGRYFFGIAYVDSDGAESGCPGLHFIDSTGQGVGVTLAGVVPSGVERIRIYGTGANGDRKELFRIAELDITDTFFAFTVNEFGSPIETLFLEPVPVPDLITAYNGYLYFAINDEVFYSESMRYGLYHEDHNSLGKYSQDVTVLERGQDGVWVVADRTNAYVGRGPKDFELKDNVFDYPAVKFSGKQIEGDLFDLDIGTQKVPIWFSSRGAVLGLPQGKVLPVMKGKAEPDFYNVGASGTVEFNGIRSVVTALDEYKSPGDSVALQDTFSVKVIKRGIE